MATGGSGFSNPFKSMTQSLTGQPPTVSGVSRPGMAGGGVPGTGPNALNAPHAYSPTPGQIAHTDAPNPHTEVAHPQALLIDVSGLSPEDAAVRLVEHASRMGASDLFLVADEEQVSVQVRHLGIVQPIALLTREQGRRITAFLLTASGMAIDERRRPQDGRYLFQTGQGDDRYTVDLRLNMVPTMYGEDLAVRLLPRGKTLYRVENLGMTREQQQHFRQMIQSPSGLVLVTGPTGSGKTATLYSALIALNDGRRKINTIEDPIEYAVQGLRQSQVHTAIDLGFAELLRAVLRQSPDAIMIGEIRDAETARTAVHAANSGVLVLATLHAPSASGAIQSMRAYGVKSHFLAASLRGVVAQRLIRTLDPHTRIGFDLSDAPHTFDEIRHLLARDEGGKLYMAASHAPGEGYADRTGIFEVLPVSRSMRDLIASDRSAGDVRRRATEERHLTFRQAALLKVAKGETTTEEVFRVIPTEHLESDEDDDTLPAAPPPGTSDPATPSGTMGVYPQA